MITLVNPDYGALSGVNALNYGMDRTGVADSTAALRAAVAAAQAQAQPGYAGNQAATVYVPSGRFLLSGKIAVPEGVEIRGEGLRRTNFYYGSTFTDNAVFEPAAIDQSQQTAWLDGFSLYGQNAAGVPTTNQANGGGATTANAAVTALTISSGAFSIIANNSLAGYAASGTLSVGATPLRIRYQSINQATNTFQNCYLVGGALLGVAAIAINDAISPITTQNIVGISWIGLGGPTYIKNVWVEYHSSECLYMCNVLGTVVEDSNFTNSGRDTILHDVLRPGNVIRNCLVQYANTPANAGNFACIHFRGQQGVLRYQGMNEVAHVYSELSAANTIGLWFQNCGAAAVDTFNLLGGAGNYASQVGVQIDASESSPLTQDSTHSANISLRNIASQQIGRVTLLDNVRGYSTPANASANGRSVTRYDTEDAPLQGIAAKTYSASITPNTGQWNTIAATNATAFTINAPFTPPTDQNAEMTIEIFNNSGGALGAITFNAIYKFALGAFTAPAATLHRYVTFRWNGTNWIAIAMATADY